jgi:hypothetical protein
MPEYFLFVLLGVFLLGVALMTASLREHLAGGGLPLLSSMSANRRLAGKVEVAMKLGLTASDSAPRITLSSQEMSAEPIIPYRASAGRSPTV